MYTREAQASDIPAITYRAGDQLTDTTPLENPATEMRTVCGDDGSAIGIWGMTEFMPHIGLFWAVLSDNARGEGLALTRMADLFIHEMVEQYSLVKSFAVVRSDKKEYQRWIQLLGFSEEYVMRDVLPDNVHLVGYSKWHQ